MKKVILLYLSMFFMANTALSKESMPSLEIKELASGIYLHTSFEHYEGFGVVASNGLVVVDKARAYIIDTPTSSEDTEKLVSWLVERDFTVEASISTHFHEDSSAGIEWLNGQSIDTYASTMTNQLLNNAGRTMAKKSFDEGGLWVVEGLIEVFYPGAGHTKDNVVVWLPRQRILFGGCFVKSESLGNLGDAVVEAWPESAQNVISRYGNADMVVPGHGETGDASLLERTKHLALEAAMKSKPAATAKPD